MAFIVCSPFWKDRAMVLVKGLLLRRIVFHILAIYGGACRAPDQRFSLLVLTQSGVINSVDVYLCACPDFLTLTVPARLKLA